MQCSPSRSALPASSTFNHLIHLKLLEIAVLQKELPSFVSVLTKNNLIVSAIQNHHFLRIQLLYNYFQSVEFPLPLAQKFAQVFSLLKN